MTAMVYESRVTAERCWPDSLAFGATAMIYAREHGEVVLRATGLGYGMSEDAAMLQAMNRALRHMRDRVALLERGIFDEDTGGMWT